MLYQIHWQWLDGRTEFLSQNEIPDDVTDEDGWNLTREWFGRVKEEFPCPSGARFLVCNEKAKEFLWAATPNHGPGGEE